MIARAVVHRLLGRIATGTLVVSESGRRHTFGAGSPTATVQVHSPRVWRMLLRGSAGMADAYADGLWDSPDLVALVRLAARNAAALDRARRRWRFVVHPVQRARALARPGNRKRSRRDIAAHYDLGNDLFSRMLDPTMSYSCAIFGHERMTLEEAQRHKLERICDKLELGPGDRVLEIGTGWGGFAVHAAATRGCHVTTTTISAEQFEYARSQVREAGLEDRVDVLKLDYRDLAGSFDKLVSIEMIEAVGWRHFGTFFSKCRELLAPGGTMLLQAITIDDRAYAVEKASRSFMSTRIFPGGCLPSLEVMTHQLSRRTDLQVVDLDDISAHYVPTLREWRANFNRQAPALAERGYDERFQRTWTLYLAYCEAGFAERRICDLQLLLARPPWHNRTLRLEKSLLNVHQRDAVGSQSG
jgi:cyclopropane-fatty-acyl-phospholipid synthase